MYHLDTNKSIAGVYLQLRVVHYLLYAMGNTDYADSQRQASITLEVSRPKGSKKEGTWAVVPLSLTIWNYF